MAAAAVTRIPFFGGNWKCNGTAKSVVEMCQALNSFHVPKNAEVIIAPTLLHLNVVAATLKAPYQVAAQNCVATNGAFTGEVSADMLVDAGINWVILGHSERRQYYNDTDAVVGQKVKAALGKNLSVIACIGETLAEREADKTLEVCFRQLKAIADNVADWSRVVVAYEPVWAIGTGKVATPAQAQEVHAALRKWLEKNCSASVANSTRIIYGGSVNGANAADIFSQPDVDGALVGGASLKPKEFFTIFSAGQSISKL